MYMNIFIIVLAVILLVALAVALLLLMRGKHSNAVNSFAQGSDKALVSDSLNLAINRLRPHFLNNILTTIYYLCDTDPQKAQSLTATFSEYLLNALEALKSSEIVSFSWELGLIRNYLALEKTRLEDKLNVDYDVDITDFKVPALSVLMLVESAVKQGISSLDRAGTVTISTRRLAGGLVQIKVSDDGEAHDKLSGKAAEELKQDIETVRKLLKKHFDGELKTEVNSNGGTVSIITMKPE